MYFLLDCRNNRSIKITINNVAMLHNSVKIMILLSQTYLINVYDGILQKKKFSFEISQHSLTQK